MFRDNPEFLDQLYDRLKEHGLDEIEEFDDEGNVSNHILIRQMYWVLQMPIIKEYKNSATKCLIKRCNVV